METESIKDLYQRRLAEKITINKINETDDVEQAWDKIKSNVINSANEAIGTRKIKINPKKWQAMVQ